MLLETLENTLICGGRSKLLFSRVLVRTATGELYRFR